jgi:gliding motility-associated-like protein
VVLTSNASSGNEWLGVGTPVPTTGSITLSVTTPNISLRVTDANGCRAVSSTVSVKVDTLPKITLLRDTALIIRDDFQLAVSRFPANARVYDWYQEGNLLGQSNEPRFSFTAGQTSRYWVILTDSNGCRAQDTVLVRVGSEVFVPNSFSPNGDRRNDRFKVYGFGVRDIEVRIWDRLGNLVYETDRVDDIVETSDSEDTVKGWDGTWKGKELSQESYIWSIKGTFNSGETLRVRGGKNSGSVLLMN